MKEAAKERVQGALDKLGVALASHGHKWSDEERAAYEWATRALKPKAGPAPRRRQLAARR